MPDPTRAEEGERRHASQEGLDTRVVLIPRYYAVQVVALLLVTLAGLGWGIFGKVPTKVYGRGIVLQRNHQSFVIEAVTAGGVREILVSIGDAIEKDQVVARLELPELEEQLVVARDSLSDLQDELERTKKRTETSIASQKATTQAQLDSIAKAVERAKQQSERLKTVADAESSLADQRDISRVTANQAQDALDDVLMHIDDLGVQASTAQASLESIERTEREKLEEAERSVRDQQKTVKDLETRLKRRSEVTSPAAGRVAEIRVGIGQNVGMTDVLMSATSGDDTLEVTAFLDVADGSRAKQGLPVHVIPETVHEAEYGSMRGEVISVSQAPVSRQQIDTLLRDEDLADMFSQGGPPYYSRIRLFPDEKNPDGYQWWVGKGPPFQITAGTLASVEIVVNEEPPIAVVLPAVREFLGL